MKTKVHPDDSTGVVPEKASELDNPVWSALRSHHASFADGDDLAKRYPSAVTPLAGLREQSADSYKALGKILGPGGTTGLFLEGQPAPPQGWAVMHSSQIVQMICTNPQLSTSRHEVRRLGSGTLPEMLALAQLTEPGPFGPRTPELGIYLGIFESGRLVAMAGERLRLNGFSEVSAVCTHREFRGRGYAGSLVSVLVREIVDRGNTPFLHVKPNNSGAIQLYEKLGFKSRRLLDVAVLKSA